MSVNVFSNPFNGSPVVWNAQGALISWAAVDTAITEGDPTKLTNAQNTAATTVTNQLNNYDVSNEDKRKTSIQKAATHVFACLTGIQIQYGRQTSTQYPIGGYNPIRILGAPAGQCSLSSLLGPSTDLDTFLEAACQNCKQIVLGIKPFSTQAACTSAVNGNQPIIVLKGCSVNQLGFNIQSQGQGISLINVPINLEFTNLTWNQGVKTNTSIKAFGA